MSSKETFQFTINQDDIFQVDNVQGKTAWADGGSYEIAKKPVEALEIAYSNHLMFDPSALNTRNYPYAANEMLITWHTLTRKLINQQE